eukprot:2424278-Pleurochrysis_carterae.AAC.1
MPSGPSPPPASWPVAEPTCAPWLCHQPQAFSCALPPQFSRVGLLRPLRPSGALVVAHSACACRPSSAAALDRSSPTLRGCGFGAYLRRRARCCCLRLSSHSVSSSSSKNLGQRPFTFKHSRFTARL